MKGEKIAAIALLTQTSIGPRVSSTELAARSTASASATSAETTSAWPPAASTSLRAPSSPSSPRATRPTRAPSRAKATAVARPTPAEAPVTTTTSPIPRPLEADSLGGRCLLLGRRRRSDRTRTRLLHEIEDAHPVHEHDRAAEPAAEGQEAEPDEREDQRAGRHCAVDVASVPEDRREQEESRRGQHREQMQRGRAPQRAAPGDGEPVDQAGQRRRDGHDECDHEREPPRRGRVVLRDPERTQDSERRRGGIGADGRVRERGVQRVSGKASEQIAELHAKPPVAASWGLLRGSSPT